MSNLQKALSILSSGKIQKNETEAIDKALATSTASMIPSDLDETVIDYIEINLTYNTPTPDQLEKLEELLIALKARKTK